MNNDGAVPVRGWTCSRGHVKFWNRPAGRQATGPTIDVKWMNYLTNHYERNVVQITSISHTIPRSLIGRSFSIGGRSSHDLTTKRIDLK